MFSLIKIISKMKTKRDSNQAEIVAALRRVGAMVDDQAEFGGGRPDIIVGFRKQNFRLEIKTKTGKLNKRQQEFHRLWSECGQICVVRTIDEALKAIGAI